MIFFKTSLNIEKPSIGLEDEFKADWFFRENYAIKFYIKERFNFYKLFPAFFVH